MQTDVLIIGGGPAGATAAMFLIREGIKPLIVEAKQFPRYHIGESMTGEAGQVLRTLGLEAAMYEAGHPIKYGVKVYGQNNTGSWFVPVMGRDENSALIESETWQVRRSVFDKMMLDEAVARGATLLHGKALTPLVDDDGAVCGAKVRLANGKEQLIHSKVLLDCSGLATWLANQGGVTGPKYLGLYDKQIAIFSHVRGAIRDVGETRETYKDNTLIFYQKKYHWAWFIPIDDEIVSVGIGVPAAYFLSKKESKQDFLRRELLELHPELQRRLSESEFVEYARVIPNYSYQVNNFCGRGFMCLGDAHRFIDPIFSFGLSVALREAQFAAPAVRAYLEGQDRDLRHPFAAHQLYCEQGIDVLEDGLDTFWEYPTAFAFAVHDRYRDEMIDVFAGRIYPHEQQPSAAIQAMRKLLKRAEARTISYTSDDLYSIPIGSRYHPERAPIWQVNIPLDLM